MKHTQGPWATDFEVAQKLIREGEKIDGATIYAPGGDEIATIRHDPSDNLDLVGKDADEHKANGHLLAAAPELLAALEALVCEPVRYNDRTIEIDCASHYESQMRVTNARKAIKKAKGE